MHEVAAFQREQPAWRLYMVSSVIGALCEALDWQNSSQVGDAYEAFCRETPWGALYFAVAQGAPRSAARTALRLKAVLRFWDDLQSVRYLFKSPGAVLTLEELMSATCDWAMAAWVPDRATSIRERLEVATERMASATKDDCITASLREMPRALAQARALKHRHLLADPAFLQQRLAALDPESFERISGARTPDLLGQLYDWDHQQDQQ